MLWKLAAACLLMLGACAHIEPPPGGPEDLDPPLLVGLQPDSLAVVPAGREPVVFQFDERIAEAGVEDAVLVSPRTSRVEVSRRGSAIRVGLQDGWEPGQIYHVTIRPTLQDLWRNQITQPLQLVFSTGPEIPDTRLAGTVTDRITGRPEIDVRVEAIRRADSLVYAIPTDSAGRFAFVRIPEGEYQVRALRDLNRNRELDAFEPFDSAAAVASIGDSAGVRLAVLAPDTTPPTATSARVSGALIEMTFDDYLLPGQSPSPMQIQIVAANGATVPAALARVGKLDATPPAAAPDSAAPDSAAPDSAAPAEPLPVQTLIIEAALPLAPETEYRVRVEGVRNIVGLSGTGEATVTTPAAAPPPPIP